MSPYLQTFERCHAQGPPHIPWAVALDFHLQHGVVIAEADLFVMARQVDPSRPEEHALLIDHKTDSRCWHIWAAAGDLGDLIDLGWMRSAREVTFQRRDGRLHTYTLDQLLRFASPAMARR